MNEIPTNVLKDLIELGELRESNNESEQILKRLTPFYRAAYLQWQDWYPIVDTHTTEQLSNLIRGLVIAGEKLPNWSGGSVSSVIWTFRAYQNKTHDEANNLADWILQNSSNPWCPFGSSRGEAKTIEEYKTGQQAKHLHRVESEKRIESEQRCKIIKETIHRRQHRESLLLQKAKSEARNSLIAELDASSVKERLEHIAWDDEHELTFYPKQYANVSKIEFNSLDIFSRARLIEKMNKWHKGPWVELLARIQADKKTFP